MASNDKPPPAYSSAGTESPPAYTEREPNTPAPDGDGPLGPPLKRMMYIGGALIIYFILAFWMPVYWMRASAAFCQFRCSQYYSGGTTVTYGSSTITVGGSGVGCYESTEPTCEDLCLDACDVCEDLGDICTDVQDLAYEAAYLNSGRPVRLVSFSLKTIGIALGFVAVILGYFGVKKGNLLYSKISTALLGFGGIAMMGGAIIFLATWNEAIDFEEFFAAAQLLVLIEWLLPSIIAVTLAVDILKPHVLNDERKRMLYMTIPFAVFGLMGGFLMAYMINWEPDGALSSYDFPLYDQGGCIAAGYFFIGLMATARILIWGEYVKVSDNPASVITAKFAVSVLLVIGGFILACGYWAWIAAVFDCEYNALLGTTICEGAGMILYVNGDTVAPSWVDVPGVPYESRYKCYYVAYTFFMLGMSAILAFDMGIVANYKTVRTAQKAAS